MTLAMASCAASSRDSGKAGDGGDLLVDAMRLGALERDREVACDPAAQLDLPRREAPARRPVRGRDRAVVLDWLRDAAARPVVAQWSITRTNAQ